MDNGLNINDLTIGVSTKGAVAYYDEIHTTAITDARNAVLNLESVKTALRNGWQGIAEQTFENNMAKGAEIVAQQLDVIDGTIASLIADMVETWDIQDKNMVEEDSSAISFGGGN